MDSILRFLTFISFVTLLFGSPFSEKYERFCKSSRSGVVQNILNVSNGLVEAFTRPYVFTNKLSPDGLQIDLSPELVDDSAELYIIEKVYKNFEEGPGHMIGAFIDGRDQSHDIHIGFTNYMPMINKNKAKEYIIWIRVFDSAKNFKGLTSSYYPDGETFRKFPIIRAIGKTSNETGNFLDMISTYSYVECKQDYCSLVFSEDSRQRIVVNMYDQNGLKGHSKNLDFLPISMLIRSVIKDEALNRFNLSVYLIFNNTFGLYEIISTDQLVQRVKRTSFFRDNRVWFGCQLYLCLNSEIDAITLSPEGKVHIFSGRFFWKWDKLEQFPKSGDAFLLKPEFRHIDSAFLDPKTSKVYVIKGEKLMDFNNNQFKDQTEVSKVFSDFKGKVDAIDYDFNSDEIHLFSNDMSWNYLRQSDNSYKFKDKKSLKELDIPQNLDAVFTDENGDQIYIKKNYHFWREYGVMTKHLIQRYFMCSDEFYTDLRNHEIKSLKDLESDLNSHQKIDFDQKPIPTPTPIPILSSSTDDNLSTDVPNNRTKLSDSEKHFDFFWIIVILVIIAIVFTVGFIIGGVVYLCFRTKPNERRKTMIRKKLDEAKAKTNFKANTSSH